MSGFVKVNQERYGIIYNEKEYEIKCSTKKWTELQAELKALKEDEKTRTNADLANGMINFVKEILPDLDIDEMDISEVVQIYQAINKAVYIQSKNELSPE